MVLLAQRGGSFWKLIAMADALAEIRSEPGESRLFDEICATGPVIGHESYRSATELRAHALDHIRAAVELLERKGEQNDVDAFGRFIVRVAEDVARADPDTDEPVAAAEQDAIVAVSAVVDGRAEGEY